MSGKYIKNYQPCEFCGELFLSGKYNHARFCSKRCRRFGNGRYSKDGLRKKCNRCKELKPLPEFYTNEKGYISTYCRLCERERRVERACSAEKIFQYFINRRKDSYVTKEAFIGWYNSQPKKCVYCSISEKLWNKYYSKERRNITRLTIDRIDNSMGYNIENIALSCWDCNRVKNNILTYEEMKEVGDKYIKPKWQKKIKKELLCVDFC